jgi:hypothetical protein
MLATSRPWSMRCMPMSHGPMDWREDTFADAKLCGAIGRHNGRRSIRVSSRLALQAMPRVRSSSRSIKRSMTCRERCWLTRWSVTSSGREWVDHALRHPRAARNGLPYQPRIDHTMVLVRSAAAQADPRIVPASSPNRASATNSSQDTRSMNLLKRLDLRGKTAMAEMLIGV